MTFKAIKAKRINHAAMRRELQAGVAEAAKNVFSDFEKTVQSWNNKITFTLKVRSTPNVISFLVKTDSDLYKLLDITGAKPHMIFPKNAKVLSYQKDFTPKTEVGVIGSRAGGKSGAYVNRKSVKHPGFEPRDFSKTIAKSNEKRFLAIMRVAMSNAVDASGHRL